MILMILCGSILAYILSVLWSRRKFYRLHEKLKNESWCPPILGNMLELIIGDNEALMSTLVRFCRFSLRDGGLTSLWIGPQFNIVVSDAKIAEIILKTYLSKGEKMTIMCEILGNGSIFAPVQIWRPRRKMLAPIFSINNLNRFVEVFNRQSSVMVEHLKSAAGAGAFSTWTYLSSYTMDSVCESTLGEKVNAQLQSSHPFLKGFQQICELGSRRIFLPRFAQILSKYLPAYEQIGEPIRALWNFVDNIILKKQQEAVEKKEKMQQHEINVTKQAPPQVNTLLELMIEASGGSSGFTNLELREEVLVMTLAGTDTSAVGSCFTCLMLARHPEVQDKVLEELKAVLGETDGAITAADLPKLKYLEAVVKESMRLYPPVPFINRAATEDFQLPSGVTIVKGTELLISIWAVHRNPKYWGEDAEQFRPERFLSYSPVHPAQYMPFSHGPRACLGYKYAMMSMKTVLAKLVRHYRILPASPVQDKDEPLRVKFETMMKHVDDFQLQLQPRNN